MKLVRCNLPVKIIWGKCDQIDRRPCLLTDMVAQLKRDRQKIKNHTRPSPAARPLPRSFGHTYKAKTYGLDAMRKQGVRYNKPVISKHPSLLSTSTAFSCHVSLNQLKLLAKHFHFYVAQRGSAISI